IAAQVGVAARSDLQSLARKRYGRRVSALLLVSWAGVNVVAIAAELQAGAAGIGMLARVDSRWLVLPLGVAVAGLLVTGRYGLVVTVLRYLLPGFLAFTVAAVLARPDWPRLAESSLIPALSLHHHEPSGALALTATPLPPSPSTSNTLHPHLHHPAAHS